MKILLIKFPIGQTFIRALTWLTILLLLLEGSVRIPPAKNFLSKYEDYGSSHIHFDIQVKNIRARAELTGKIDCIFIGNSQVLYGVDPAIVEDIYLKKTGKKIICQNFGLGNLSPVTAKLLIEVLIKNYHPSVFIVGINIFDYMINSPAHGARAHASITSSPWLKYQMGIFSVDGWLIENSLSYKYYLGLDRYALSGNLYPASIIEKNGHFVSKSGEPESMTPAEQREYVNNLAKDLALRQDQVDALNGLLKLQTDETKIIIMETPTPPDLFETKKRATKMYPEFVDMLHDMTEQTNTKVWFTQNELKIPTNGWRDIFHLNSIGAAYFSAFVGEKINELSLHIK